MKRQPFKCHTAPHPVGTSHIGAWRGKGQIREEKLRLTQVPRYRPTLGMMAIMTLKSRSLLPQPEDDPRAQTGKVVQVAADEAKLAGQSGRKTLTSGQSDLVVAMNVTARLSC